VESENAYEGRRLELGLPSLEERREKAAADTEATREQLLKIRAQEQVQEEYWRSRASALRSEIAQTDARIDYVRTRLNELPSTTPLGAFSPVLPFWTFVSGRVSPALGPGFVPGPHIIPVTSVPNVGARVSNGGVGGFRPAGINHNPRPGMRGPGMTSRFPIASGWGVPFQTYDYSYEYSRLISELDELRTHRAGLQSLWRDLEEDARRAGAYPGWLRP
jgi:hypothetical protein